METEPAEVRGFAQSGARASEFPVFVISALTRNLGAVCAALARDSEIGLPRVLTAGSLVVVAASKRWWPMAKSGWLGRWHGAGHSFAVLESEKGNLVNRAFTMC